VDDDSAAGRSEPNDVAKVSPSREPTAEFITGEAISVNGSVYGLRFERTFRFSHVNRAFTSALGSRTSLVNTGRLGSEVKGLQFIKGADSVSTVFGSPIVVAFGD